ncbi:MAG: glycosyltransferase, partial [Candidatus Dadabacteria bacterium]|nr:glycosyltransferase [Candidatus Dadabacteria bacterium]
MERKIQIKDLRKAVYSNLTKRKFSRPLPMVYLPRVSVIVPIYDAESTLAACINSLLGLNYPKENLELILVNNASTD